MYFKSREAAGKLLAGQIAKKYLHQPCTVIALDDGGVVVGLQIAVALCCPIMLLTSENVDLPHEPAAIGGIAPDGSFTLNEAYNAGQLTELTSEYHNFIEQEKMRQMHAMNRASGEGTLLRRDLIKDHIVILVSDGLEHAFSLDLALKYLKPMRIKRLIVATPLASVPAVDRMHIGSDEIFCLNVLADYFSTDHYYDLPDVPEHEDVVYTVDRVLTSWDGSAC